MGNRQLAESWYASAAEHVTAYYGQLAATRLGASPGKALAEPQPRPEETAAFNRRDLVQAVRLLAQVNADDYVRPFLLRLSDIARTPGEHALIARLAGEIARPDLAVAAAKKASYAGVTLLAEGYPLPDLPPGGSVERSLVLAMTRQESAFDGDAVSRVGARGLMQLMPATASTIARSMHMPFSAKRLTSDRHYNVTLGRAYLNSLLGDFGGSYVLAIAAYNAGPARVRQWMDDYGDPRRKGVDVVDWIESIPFGETRNYVQRVLENLQVYRLRLGDRSLAFSLAADLKR
jgi:soluble lytic murein transglycosylase